MVEPKLVIAFGELLWDLLPSGPALGGAPANFAFRLQTLGTQALPVSRVGTDDLGDQAVAILNSHGLNTSLIQRDPQTATGTVNVTLNERGDASYVINTGVAYDLIELNPQLAARAAQATVIYYGSLIQRHQVARSTLGELLKRAPNALKFCDLNLRNLCYSAETVRFSLEQADVLKLNAEEVTVVCDLLSWDRLSPREFCPKVIKQFSLQSCLVTRAADGAYCVSDTGEVADISGHKVKVEDTVGSGDSFAAGFIHSLLSAEAFTDCCAVGNRLGALVATKRGPMCEFAEGEIAPRG